MTQMNMINLKPLASKKSAQSRQQHVFSLDAGNVLAKMLAGEDISIRISSKNKTASWDLENKVLTIPSFALEKDAPECLFKCYIAHEVSHVLFTPPDPQTLTEAWKHIDPTHKNPLKNRRAAWYLNLCEDIRCDHAMGGKYQGLRKLYSDAYKYLAEKDYKEAPEKIDNLATDTVGMKVFALHRYRGLSNISFGTFITQQEKDFYNRCVNATCFEDVVDVAKEMYDLDREDQEEEPEESEEEQKGGGSGGMLDAQGKKVRLKRGSQPQDPDYKKRNQNLEAWSSGATEEEDGEEVEELSEEESKNLLDSLMENFVETTDDYFTVNIPTYSDLDPKSIVPFTHFIDEVKKSCPNLNEAAIKNDLVAFRKENTNDVLRLCAQFERWKAADLHERTQQNATGELDMRRVFMYKTDDDIFRNETTIAKGKNHGIMIVVDWSGSMDCHMSGTLHQLMGLVSFARRQNIPCAVYAFSDAFRHKDYEIKKGTVSDKSRRGYNTTIDFCEHAHLLELFSPGMTALDFETMCGYVVQMVKCFSRGRGTSTGFAIPAGYGLGGTPLNNAILQMAALVPNFISQTGVQIMNTVVMTDGDDTNFGSNLSRMITSSRFANPKVILRDPISGAQRTCDEGSQYQYTSIILELMKSRCPINSLGFFVMSGNYVENMLDRSAKTDPTSKQAKLQEYSAKGYTTSASLGYDKYFLLNSQHKAPTQKTAPVIGAMSGNNAVLTEIAQLLAEAVKPQAAKKKN